MPDQSASPEAGERRGVERRLQDLPFAGPDRRQTERRSGQDRRGAHRHT